MNEIEYIQKLSRSSPEEIAAQVLEADERQARVLRIYLGTEQFDRMRAAASRRLARGARDVVKRGNVVVLHGIMGGDLSLYGTGSPSLIWVQALSLIAGHFDRLVLDDAGNSINDIRESGIYLRYYGSLLVSLSQEWNVRPFFYDWRRDINFAADGLKNMLNQFPDEPVHLVAHSMGGLVARAFIAKYPERWNVRDAAGKRANLIMLGTPNYGSFAVPRLLLGTNDVLSLLEKVDLTHNNRQILDIAKTFVGTYQMMPAKGHMEGLEVLYDPATYSVTPIRQALLDKSLEFQQSISGVIDKDRMAYVAGYNRVSLAGIKDVTQLANDNGYVLSKRGDGTVPHDLGLLPGVRTFYVDEEHMKLPANAKVQAALTDLIETCDLPNENLLWKGLGPEFRDQRGAETENQQVLLAARVALRAVKEQQISALRNAILSRGTLRAETVSPEQQALADALIEHDPLPLMVAGHDITERYIPVAALKAAEEQPAAGEGSPAVQQTPVPLRVHMVQKSIGALTPGDAGDPAPIDCIAVGHYLRVRPTGAELDLDKAISAALRPDGQEGILSTFHERGVLRGDLGVPFLLPDPRKGYENVLIAVAGMGPTGQFGVPELSLLARELCWTAAQLGKRHLAAVLIGAGAGNLSYVDAIQGWITGISRALANSSESRVPRLEAITFVIPSRVGVVANALRREAAELAEPQSPLHFLELELVNLPDVPEPRRERVAPVAPTRINIEFDPSGVCRYSALTDSASIAERVIRLDPRRIQEASARLLLITDAMERYKLGRFLLEFLFPRDLRAQLTGSAPVILQLNSEAAKVYWEVTAQPLTDDDPITADAMPFLGLQRGLTRQLRTVLAPPPEPPPPAGRVLRVLIVADGNKQAPLPGAQREAQMLMALFDRVNELNRQAGNTNRIIYTSLIGPSQATALDVLLRISDQPPFDILHYAGHCVYDAEKPERSGLLFSDDDRLTAADLDRIDRTPKFVFANACESGVMPSRPELSSPELPAAFAEEFFKKGVANFVCTAWPVADEPASQFAAELYRNLAGDGVPTAPMFEAVRAARRRIADTPTWGAYQHYGDPYFRLFR